MKTVETVSCLYGPNDPSLMKPTGLSPLVLLRYGVEQKARPPDGPVLCQIGTIMGHARNVGDMAGITGLMLPSTRRQEDLNSGLDYCLPSHVQATVAASLAVLLQLEANGQVGMDVARAAVLSAVLHDSGKVEGANGRHQMVSHEHTERSCAMLAREGYIGPWVAHTVPRLVAMHHSLWDAIQGSHGLSEHDIHRHLPDVEGQLALGVLVMADTSWDPQMWQKRILPHVPALLPLAWSVLQDTKILCT